MPAARMTWNERILNTVQVLFKMIMVPALRACRGPRRPPDCSTASFGFRLRGSMPPKKTATVASPAMPAMAKKITLHPWTHELLVRSLLIPQSPAGHGDACGDIAVVVSRHYLRYLQQSLPLGLPLQCSCNFALSVQPCCGITGLPHWGQRHVMTEGWLTSRLPTCSVPKTIAAYFMPMPPSAEMVKSDPKALPRCWATHTSARMLWMQGMTIASPRPFTAHHAAACSVRTASQAAQARRLTLLPRMRFRISAPAQEK